MFKILVDYPSVEEERLIVEATTADKASDVKPVLGREEIIELQAAVRRIPAAPSVVDHAIELVRKTRVKTGDGVPDFVRQWVSWGAGPRASQYLVLGAKARAALDGKHYASVSDLRSMAKPVLRHRILTNFAAEADGITPDTVIDKLLETTPPTDGDLTKNPDVSPAFSG
jgi:MoxR-like ATPase